MARRVHQEGFASLAKKERVADVSPHALRLTAAVRRTKTGHSDSRAAEQICALLVPVSPVRARV